METYYLVDYENVNGDGLAGCEKLDELSHIIIFFTANARKIDMCDIADHGSASLEMMQIPAGKQSTDMHIGSYLGYLVGANPAGDFRVVVVSGDTDFDGVVAFWREKRGIKAHRAKRINGAAAQNSTAKALDTKAVLTPEKKMAINVEVMHILRNAGYPTEVVGPVASTVAKFLGTTGCKQSTYRAVISKYGQQKGLDIYRRIKEAF